VGSYSKIYVGELVWVPGDETNGFMSGYGLVVKKAVTKLDYCYMFDIIVLHGGIIYRPTKVTRLGVL